jgi:hypothetical protein
MRLNFCVICGVDDDLNHHHVVPLSLGGQDCEENIITLCCTHHDWIHNIQRHRNLKFIELVKAGQLKSNKPNRFGGRPPHSQEKINEIIKLWESGMSYRQIRSKLKISIATVQKYVTLHKSKIKLPK